MNNKHTIRATYDSTTLQAIGANEAIQFQNVTSADNCSITVNGGTISLKKAGTYSIFINVSTSAATAGTEEIQLLRHGFAVQGAHAMQTASTAGDFSSMSFEALVSVSCNTETLEIQSVPATNVRIANLVIKKVY